MNSKIEYIFSIVFLCLSIFSEYVFTQTVTYDSLPSLYQLYPRNETDNDSAIVIIKGAVDNFITYDSIIVEIDTNSVIWRREAQVLSYSGSTADFLLKPKIYTDTVEFSFKVLFREGSNIILDKLINNVVCGDVFLVEGQSNAEAEDQGGFEPYTVKWMRTFGSTVYDPSVSHDSTWDLGQAEFPVTHAFVGIWGLRLGKLIVEEYSIPVCIINGAEGGTDIQQHLPNDANPEDLNTIYGRLLWRAAKAGINNKIKAIIWWQGESNTNKEIKADEYNTYFPILRSDWQNTFVGINKIYTTQIHAGYSSSEDRGIWGCLLREHQRTLAEGDVDTEIMTAHNLSGHDGAHFSPAGYDTFAVRLFRQIRRDFYDSGETININPPNISQAYFINAQKDVLVLKFDSTSTLVWQNDSTFNSETRFLKDYFYFHNINSVDTSIVDTAQIFGNLLRLELDTTSNALSVTYLPNRYYNGTTENYAGPWLRNSRGIPALSFYQFPIESEFGDVTAPSAPTGLNAVTLSTSQIDLDWDESIDPESGISYYKIYRDNSEIGQSLGITFSDTGLIAGLTYIYEVSAVNGVWLESSRSEPDTTATFLDVTVPSTPTNLNTLAVDTSQIDLDWSESTDPESGISYYKVYRDNNFIAQSQSITYSDTGLSTGVTYIYEVSAVNGVGLESSRSDPDTATTLLDITPPSTPTNLNTVAVDTSQINLDWSESTDPESGISYYKVYRDNNFIAQSQNIAYGDTGLSAGVTYIYEVSAVNGVGLESSRSTPDTAETFPTSLNDPDNNIIPEKFSLFQNYPNPFNPNTVIKYQISEAGRVQLTVFNTLGEKIKTIVDERLSSGIYTVSWNGTNDLGIPIASGVYFCQLLLFTKKVFQENKKLILLK